MNVPRSTFRAPGIAVLAIAGMLSMVGEASACAAKTTRACCVVRPSGDCGCCRMMNIAEPMDARLGSVASMLAEAPARGCGCRVDNPAEPADPAPPTPSELRSDPGHGDLPLVVRPARSVVSRAWPGAPAQHRDGVPLYLRHAHLLI